MDYARIPSYPTAPVTASQPPELKGSQAVHRHPNTLSPARLSSNAKFDLDLIEARPDGRHQLLAFWYVTVSTTVRCKYNRVREQKLTISKTWMRRAAQRAKGRLAI